MKKQMMRVLAVVFTACTVQADRLVDYAAEKAAADAIRQIEAKLNKDGAEAGNIAFLPLFNDESGIYPVVRAGLTGVDSSLEFFMREPADWQNLVNEIEFGQKRSDIMNKATIQSFGSVEGVDALLYGEVREAGAKDEHSGIVRMTLYLADVETGEQIASAIAQGIAEEDQDMVDKLLAAAGENWKRVALGVGVVVVLLTFITKNSRPR